MTFVPPDRELTISGDYVQLSIDSPKCPQCGFVLVLAGIAPSTLICPTCRLSFVAAKKARDLGLLRTYEYPEAGEVPTEGWKFCPDPRDPQAKWEPVAEDGEPVLEDQRGNFLKPI